MRESEITDGVRGPGLRIGDERIQNIGGLPRYLMNLGRPAAADEDAFPLPDPEVSKKTGTYGCGGPLLGKHVDRDCSPPARHTPRVPGAAEL